MKYPDDYINKIICGDNLKIIKDIPDNVIDLIVTSPPYNEKIDYDTYKDNLPYKDYLQFLEIRFRECFRIQKENTLCFVNIVDNRKNMFKSYDIAKIIESAGYKLKDKIIWYKYNSSTINLKHKTLSNRYEFILMFSKGENYKLNKLAIGEELCDYYRREQRNKKGSYQGQLFTLEKKFKNLMKDRGNVWIFGIPKRNQNTKFLNIKASFPKQLPFCCIKIASKENDIVLDLFNGIGTTTLIAEELNRKFIGIDISPKYCKTSWKRLNIAPPSLFKK